MTHRSGGTGKLLDQNYSTETGSNGRGSARSSDDASGSAGDFNESSPSASLVDERTRIENKIQKLREKIMRNSIARESDIEEFLRTTSTMDHSKPENAQMARLRLHFDRKNKKYSQEAEQLQRKLEECEQRLQELERGGEVASRGSHHGVLHNVGHGIKRTGVNLKEMTGNMISAPFDIAQKVKKNVFGSADDIRAPTDGNSDGANVGHSVFYTDHPIHITASQSERGRSLSVSKEDEEPLSHASELPTLRLDDRSHDSHKEVIGRLVDEINSLRKHVAHTDRHYEQLKKNTEAQLREQQTQLAEARFKMQQLEQNHNETLELHQNEVKQLKNDLSLIATRMDYQYNDRFKKIEESVESTQNRIYRMETSWHENSERLLGTGQNMWNALMLSGANILVELLKIVLYFTAVLLDSVKPLTGTR
ncbi:Protein C15H9.4 [Aphelenchoides avenae]|nr:Protein C15H9.4 [Aphelenchus avenae]